MMNLVLFGTGWRSQFYVRIAKALPDRFSIQAVYTRSQERLGSIAASGLFGTTSVDEALSRPHDAVIVASGATGLADTLELLQSKGEVILSETSFLTLSDEDTERCKAIKGFALEQYPYTPLFRSVFAVADLVGPIHELRLAMLHNHHAAAIFRKTFPQYSEGFETTAVDFPAFTVKTSTRAGRCFTGEREDYTRKLRVLKGKDWFFENDFSTNMYRSYLVPSELELRGECGTITDKGVTYAENGMVMSDSFVRHFDGDKENGALTLSHITAFGRVVYRNPFYGAILNDDEIAIAAMLQDAAEGRLTYTIQDAIEDARIGKLL